MPPVELSAALGSLQTLIGAMNRGGKILDVAFITEGNSFSTDNLIRISARPIDKLPIPARDFDTLCGYSIHETAHITNQSLAVYKLLPSLPEPIATYTRQVTTIGEEIYCDRHPPGRVPAIGMEYIKSARLNHWELEGNDKLYPWDDLFAVWTAISVYHQIPTVWDPNLMASLSVLLELTKSLEQPCTPMQRKDLYVDTARRISSSHTASKTGGAPGQSPGQSQAQAQSGQSSPDSESEPDSKPESKPSKSDEQFGQQGLALDRMQQLEARARTLQPDLPMSPKKAPAQQAKDLLELLNKARDIMLCPNDEKLEGVAIPQELEDQIEESRELESEDMSDEIAKLLDKTKGRSPKVLLQNSDKDKVDKFNQKSVADLEWLRNLKLALGKQTYRDQEQGQLDQTRLHQAYTNGLIWKRSVQKKREDRQFVLLLDASSSMGYRGNPVYGYSQAAWKVLGCPIYAYDNGTGPMRLLRMHHHQELHHIHPNGTTPSGEALLATAAKHPKATIIHFTDGGANGAVKPFQALTAIDKNFPSCTVINICTGSTHEYVNDLDSNYAVNITAVEGFGKALRKELTKLLQENK